MVTYLSWSRHLTRPCNRRIPSDNRKRWFLVAGWLSDDRLVLQSHSADPSGRRWPAVWTVRADGSGLIKLADGTFLAGFGG